MNTYAAYHVMRGGVDPMGLSARRSVVPQNSTHNLPWIGTLYNNQLRTRPGAPKLTFAGNFLWEAILRDTTLNSREYHSGTINKGILLMSSERPAMLAGGKVFEGLSYQQILPIGTTNPMTIQMRNGAVGGQNSYELISRMTLDNARLILEDEYDTSCFCAFVRLSFYIDSNYHVSSMFHNKRHWLRSNISPVYDSINANVNIQPGWLAPPRNLPHVEVTVGNCDPMKINTGQHQIRDRWFYSSWLSNLGGYAEMDNGKMYNNAGNVVGRGESNARAYLAPRGLPLLTIDLFELYTD